MKKANSDRVELAYIFSELKKIKEITSCKRDCAKCVLSVYSVSALSKYISNPITQKTCGVLCEESPLEKGVEIKVNSIYNSFMSLRLKMILEDVLHE
jgi:hypothetical protein